MAEALPAFVERRRPEWAELERLVTLLDQRKISAPQLLELDRLYRRAAADLAHAQAFFAGTDVQRFLNQLCGRAYGRIYQRRPERLKAMRTFFARTFPAAVREELRFIGAAAALMFSGVVIGLTSVLLQPGLADLFVSDGVQKYVAEHRLWTDAIPMPPSETATTIIVNNLQVTVGAFASGITAGIGTLLVLITNGLSIGAVVAHCFNGGVGPGILVFMSAHGFVELSVICICGGAGLIIGHALIVPTERPRSEVLKERSTRAAQLVIGCAPFLTGIGVVEGFISPGSFFPPVLKVLLGACLGAAFWLYLLKPLKAQPHT